jgi:putative pyruvate formate lyase activating enzyme
MFNKNALTSYYRILASETLPRFKSLDPKKKIKEAFEILQDCELCSRGCRVDRTTGEKGYCRVGNKMSVSSCFDHYGEEFFFVPSFTIFFNSCTFSCQFCQNWEISQITDPDNTQLVTEAALARAIDLHNYCKNVNFVGGEPTPYLPFILTTLNNVKSNIPVVWNSNFYMSEMSMNLLRGVVDVYLTDFKYGNDECALRLSDVPNYSEIVRRNHLLAFDDTEVVIRHLIMPNHSDCCTKPILEFIAEKFGDVVVVNLMDQYRPCFKAREYPDIERRLTVEEFETAVSYARKLGLNFIT